MNVIPGILVEIVGITENAAYIYAGSVRGALVPLFIIELFQFKLKFLVNELIATRS